MNDTTFSRYLGPKNTMPELFQWFKVNVTLKVPSSRQFFWKKGIWKKWQPQTKRDQTKMFVCLLLNHLLTAKPRDVIFGMYTHVIPKNKISYMILTLKPPKDKNCKLRLLRLKLKKKIPEMQFFACMLIWPPGIT